MAAPTSYSEASLKQLMVDELGATGVALSLATSAAAITNAVYACERLLGDEIADLTDMALLEAAARWQAWLAAEAAAANQYDLKSDGDEAKRSQWFAQIQARLARAESDYYTAASVAAGSSGGGFVFATIPGCRGR